MRQLIFVSYLHGWTDYVVYKSIVGFRSVKDTNLAPLSKHIDIAVKLLTLFHVGESQIKAEQGIEHVSCELL